MKHRLLYIPIVFLFMLSFVDCAKKGRPTGGPKDTIPPVIVKSSPENYSINYDKNEIRIYFDEYIKLKDLNKELIISPPFKYQPSITPLSTSKFIKIKIEDTLKENTTYSFNFGKSIVDNNEENAFKYYKYILSTGNYIDSLSLKGSVNDALLLKSDSPTTVMLYEVNEQFQDSIIFLEKPSYISTTQDTIPTFELTNLKEGNYLLIALKEINNDYLYQAESDKIGFIKEFISIPTDSVYTLDLFKESPEYSISKPKHESKNHIIFGFQGESKELSIDLLSSVPNDFKYSSYRDFESDTIHYWFKPALEVDSLFFVASNKKKIDTLITRMRDLYIDSLLIRPINVGNLTLKDTMKIKANTPLIALDPEKISVIDRDSTIIPFNGFIDAEFNIVAINFNKTEKQNYTIRLLPGAFTDFFENTNDTLNYRVSTKELSDYGTITLNLNKVEDVPIIVQLVDERYRVISEEYLLSNKPVFFDFINKGNYYIRLIFDENENKKWDSGNYLKSLQPEKVIYYPSLLEVRSNWSLNETFNLD